MIFNEKQFLKSEITRLANEGLIDKSQEQAILETYNLKESTKFSPLFIFSLIFIGLSFILLISHNWKEIPNILKTALLLVALFSTHYGIFYFKTPIAKQGFGVLSGFVLLGNLALLSQIYHLGDDTTLAFLSVGIAMLVLAFALKSLIVFLQGYLFASIGYLLDYEFAFSVIKADSSNTFILLILLGFITQTGIFFKLSLNGSRLLALINFILLELYVAQFLGFFAGVWIPLMFLGFHCKSYQFYSYLFLAFILAFPTIQPPADYWIAILCAQISLALLSVANLYFKYYFLSIIMLGALIPYVDYIEFPFFSESHLIVLLLLGIHCIKENYKILGIFILLMGILSIYILLIGDYIGTSIIFLLFGLGLLYCSRRKNAKKP